MDIDAICRLPVHDIVAPDAVLAMWISDPLLKDAERVIAAWGFDYKCILCTWVKTTKNGAPRMGLGYYTRKECEQLLLAACGNGLPRLDRGVRQTILAPRREHSAKPDEAYNVLEFLFGPVRRLEMFARRHHPGWDAWGKEAPSGIFLEDTR